MNAFRIKGRITDKDSGKGVSDLLIKAIDKDLLFDDLLGEVITDEEGYFEIVYDKGDFQELFFDKRPDLYLRVNTLGGEEVKLRKNRVRYQANDTEFFKIIVSIADLFPLPSEFEISVLRPQDFLTLQFKFINLKVVGKNLKHHNIKKPAYIIVEFPPQNIAEQAFFEVAEDYDLDPERDKVDVEVSNGTVDQTGAELPFTPCQARIANPSRLVFKVPSGGIIEYTLEGLLDACAQYELSVAPTAFPPLIFLHPKIRPSQLTNRLELFNNIDISHVLSVRSKSFSKKNGSDALTELDAAAMEWLARSSLTKHLPREYDKDIRKEIADQFFRARFIIKPKLRPPTKTETSIESPYRLLISPNRYAAWVHAKQPVISSTTERTELWHTRYALRLGGKVEERDSALKTIRAIWTRDPGFATFVENIDTISDHHYKPGSSNRRNPFRMSLDAFDRENIVHLSANQYLPEHFPTPVDVNRLMLTSFGAWMNVRGAWEPPDGLSVEEWRHRSTMGRDHYVRVVYKGYLFPFGHRASLIKVTERKFHPQAAYILDLASHLFTAKVHSFAKSFEASSRSETGSFLRSVGESYNRNVGDLVQSISENSREEKPYLLRESRDNFRREVETLARASDNKTRSQLTSLASEAAKVFKENVKSIIESIEDIAIVKVPGNIAYLRQRMYIVVREPERFYIDSGFDNYNRQMPFSRVEITTLVTPNLDEPSQCQVKYSDNGQLKSLNEGQNLFWPKVLGNRFQFHIIAEDFAGNEVDFAAPLIFIDSSFLSYSDQTKYSDIQKDLARGSSDYQRLAFPEFGGQSIMFADSSSSPGKTTFETQNITFGAQSPSVSSEHQLLQTSLNDDDFPQFYPKVVTAEVLIPSIKHLVGNNQPVKIEYTNTFLEQGFKIPINQGEIFAKLVDNVDLDFNNQGDQSGGLAKPNMAISGLSRLMGPVAGDDSSLSTLGQGNFNPKDFFGDLDAKIFGVINLWDIIELFDFVPNDTKNLPVLLPDITKDKIEIGFEFKPPLKDWNNLFIASSKGKKAEFGLSAKLIAYTAGGTETNIFCGLRNFSIDLIGPLESFLVVHFNHIAFTTAGGKKAEVDVDLGEIEFVGILSFVEALKDFIPLDGFSDPPSLDITEKGITASFSLTLPTLAVGVFSLQNMSLGASFILPFLVDPLSVRFNFCERESPFLLTVSMFGGGGFFAITVDPAGVQRLEASFEFGASISINFGVASGGVYVMAGIYFMMEANPEKAELTGYFRMGGELDVLGIISVSIELYLSLTYEFSSGKCIGKATLTIEVEVLFFSASVEISCERKFAGSNGDPTFVELMEPYVDPISTNEVKPWEIYCQAYA